VAACHNEKNNKERMQKRQTEMCKYDATKIVNKVLDSTNIACLYGFGQDGKFAIYNNDFIKENNIQIKSKKYYLSNNCDSLEHSVEARLGKCWFLEFIRIDSISENIYRLHYAIPYKERCGYYDFSIDDYAIVDSFMIKYKGEDTVRYVIASEIIKGPERREIGEDGSQDLRNKRPEVER
jgi:hypothetical protein